MPNPDVDGIFSELGQRLGMPGLSAGEDGCCQLVFDQRHLVRLAASVSRRAIVAGCHVGAQAPSAAALRGMLRANHLRGAEGDCMFSLCPDGRAYVQCSVGFDACRAGGLLPAIEELLNQVEAWEKRLAHGDEPAGSRPPAPFMINAV